MNMCIKIILIGILILNYSSGFTQCTINFETDGDMLFGTIAPNNTDIVNFDTPSLSNQCFNVFDENTCTCPLLDGGGDDDVCIDFEMEPIFDAYGGMVISPAFDGGINHDITHQTTGFRGMMQMGVSGSNKRSTGDVTCYSITVNFAPHMHQLASNVRVNTTSINSTGQGFESAAILYLDASGTTFGSATYNGFYVDADGPGGSHPGVISDCSILNPTSGDSNFAFPTINPNPWSISGTGVYVAQATNTTAPDLNMDGTDDFGSCTPIGNGNGPDDNVDPSGTDAGLNPADIVGGFIFKVCLEDVATATADGIETSSNTNFKSTLNGFDFVTSCCDINYEIISIANCDTWDISLDNITQNGSNDSSGLEVSINGGGFVAYTSNPIATGISSGTTVDVVIRDEDDDSCETPMSITLGNLTSPSCGTFPANPSGSITARTNRN